MTPDGLGESGIRLWDGLMKGRTVDAATESLVLNAARVADRLDELTEQIGGVMTVTNDRGDEVANPLITEHRQQLQVLRAVLSTLGVGKLPAAASTGKSLQEQLAEARAERQKRPRPA